MYVGTNVFMCLSIYLEVEEAAWVELDPEVDGFGGLSGLDRPPAVRILRVALDVHHAVEVGVANVDGHLPPVV